MSTSGGVTSIPGQVIYDKVVTAPSGSADDSALIAAAITAAGPGGRVYVGPGLYKIVAGIPVSIANVKLDLHPNVTLRNENATPTQGMITLTTGAQGFGLNGFGGATLDGNAAIVTAGTAGATMTMQTAGTAGYLNACAILVPADTSAGATLTPITGVTLRDVNIINTYYVAVLAYGTGGMRLQNTSYTDCNWGTGGGVVYIAANTTNSPTNTTYREMDVVTVEGLRYTQVNRLFTSVEPVLCINNDVKRVILNTCIFDFSAQTGSANNIGGGIFVGSATGGDEVIISDCIGYGDGQFGIAVDGPWEHIIISNSIMDHFAQVGIGVQNQAHNVMIVGCSATACGWGVQTIGICAGIQCLVSSAGNMDNLSIVDCMVDGTPVGTQESTAYGILIGNIPATPIATNVKITGCTVKNLTPTTASSTVGIFMLNVTNALISNNVIEHIRGASATQKVGVIFGGASHCNVFSNIISDVGLSTDSQVGYAIQTQTTGSACAYIDISHNQLNLITGAALPFNILSGGASIFLRNNQGFNPQGFSLTTPALPAAIGSTDAVFNNSNVDVLIYQQVVSYIGNGTHIIDIYANDILLPDDSPIVRLKPGDRIYYATAVPASWRWYGE